MAIVIPPLAYGTGTKWYKHLGNRSNTIDDRLVECIVLALHSGFNHLDTAELYGTEREVGAALQRYFKERGKTRKDVFITAKVTFPDNLLQRFNDTINRLGPAVEGYVDLYLLHSPLWDYTPSSPLPMSLVWSQMESLVSSNRVKAIGVSNFQSQDLKALRDVNPTILPACNQIEFHAYLQEPELIQFCKEAFPDMRISAYGPLAPVLGFAGKGRVKEV
ncbi:UNVERIFIED_CONTAM: hypothetical protein HDU68_008055, partial [Siphonaria sp. JEL0065]